MMLRTGTSKGGRVYRYYTCSNCATKAKMVCKGRSISMDKLDSMVTDHLVERLFKPERLTEILTSLSLRHAEKSESLSRRLIQLQREVSDAEEKLKRLYRLVEDGLTDLDDVLKDRLNTLKADGDRAKAALERVKQQSWRAERRHVPATARAHKEWQRRRRTIPSLCEEGKEEGEYERPRRLAKNTGDDARLVETALFEN